MMIAEGMWKEPDCSKESRVKGSPGCGFFPGELGKVPVHTHAIELCGRWFLGTHKFSAASSSDIHMD
jgi:hypothetical protein